MAKIFLGVNFFMRKNFLMMLIILACVIFSDAKSNATVKGWQDNSYNFNGLKKIFIMPVEFDLKTSNSLAPFKKQQEDLNVLALDEANKSFRKKAIVKNYNAVVEDLNFIYGKLDATNSKDISIKAGESGYQAFIKIFITQEFKDEHVPERTRTYTEYKDINEYDRHGKIIKTVRVPVEKTEVIPAHDVRYLATNCKTWLYDLKNIEGDYKAAAEYDLYREYQGGDVNKVIENAISASVKKLLTGK